MNSVPVPPTKIPIPSLSADSEEIPSCYIRPESERVSAEDVLHEENSCIYGLDLENLKAHDNAKEALLFLDELGYACRTDGFFQAVNHGVPEKIMEETLKAGKEFFSMPWNAEKEKLHSEDTSRTVRLSTSFNIQKESVHNRREYLRLRCNPLQTQISTWPSKPPQFKSVVSEYCTHMLSLFLRLLNLITLSVKMEDRKHLLEGDFHDYYMAINHFPKCPNLELTLGLPAHTDPTLLTILLTDGIPGLHVFKPKMKKWMEVQHLPNSLIVNLGDHLQVLANGLYTSGVHRVMVNSCQPRVSIPSFFFPSPDTTIEPLQCFASPENPKKYRRYTSREYMSVFWDSSIGYRSCLESFTLNSEQQNHIPKEQSDPSVPSFTLNQEHNNQA